MKRILIGMLAALVIVLTGCASYDVEQDQTGLEIDGYLINKTDKKLVECHAAGKSGYGGTGNEVIYLPAGQRTFSFTGQSSEAEMDPVAVSFDDNQTVRQPGFIKFTLTTDCESLYDFWTKVGIKYDANTSDGWARLLMDYMGVPVTTALNDITSKVPTWDEWYGNSAARTQAQTDLVPVLQRAINESLGSDEWIKVASVSLSKPVPSESLLSGIEASEKVRLENEAIKQRNAGLLSKYDAMRDCIFTKRLPVETCNLMYLAESGSISFYPVPQGSGFNVNAN